MRTSIAQLESEDDLDVVCQECLKKTDFSRAPKRKFHHPRLKNLNRIEVHKSRTHRGLLARIGLLFVELYNAWLRFSKKMHRLIFPRRDKIYGTPNSNDVVTGHLTFRSKMADSDSPIFNMHLELWARTFWGGYRKLNHGKS
ncbi:MAG: hypothetical protein AAFN93_29605, partial [Bacteroidota bacterium]